MSSAPRVLRLARSLPSLLLIAGLLATGALWTGCGQQSPSETAAPAKSEAASDKDQKPIFSSDFEEGTTEEWTETQDEEEDSGSN